MVTPLPPGGEGNVRQSPDAAAIYNQYLSYYNDITTKIGAIDAAYPAGSEPPNVQQDRATLVDLQQKLGPIYTKDYNDPNATLASFQQDCSGIETSVAAAYADAMGGGGTIQQQIAEDYTNAQALAAALQAALGKDASALSDLTKEAGNLQSEIDQLQDQINGLPPGAEKTQAQSDLDKAKGDLKTLQGEISDTQNDLTSVQKELTNITEPGGTLDQLKQLAGKSDPTQGDLDQANGLLAIVQAAQKDEGSLAGAIGNTQGTQSTTQGDVQTVQRDLNPPPPPGPIQNGCWYIDWTSWFNNPPYTIPQGVNAINIFVGEISLDSNGNPTMGGFGNMTLDQLNAFVQQCHSQGIMVKVSIGGGGGQYDKCWDSLTATNVGAFAKMMVDFCHQHGLDGVDFDYEEFAGTDQEALVGTLIKDFKNGDPKLETSLCTNAGFGPNFPWQAVMQTILGNAMSNGVCTVDRLYIMSYTDGLAQEETWVSGWADWMEKNFGFTASRITVGIDDFDSHSYDPVAFAAWAAANGFSTCHWAVDPAHPTDLDRAIRAKYTLPPPPLPQFPLTPPDEQDSTRRFRP